MSKPHFSKLIERARPLVSSPLLHVDQDTILRCLSEDEAGDAQLLVAMMQDKLCFDMGSDKWYRFKGHHWKEMLDVPYSLVWSGVASEYLALSSLLQAEAGETTLENGPKRLNQLVDALTTRAQRLRTIKRTRNVLYLARELVAISGNQWDSDPWLLGVANGVLDLQTGILRAGRPCDYIRNVAPVEWQGLEAPCPRWEHFISEIMSNEADRIRFLQQLLGYSINGTTREHILVLLVGSRGRNGKRVLCETIKAVLDPYAAIASTDIVIGQERRTPGSAQPHLMDLHGRRFVVASETGEYARLSTAQVKNITGGDLINARRLHANPVTFAPTHTIFLQTNHKPQAPSDDDALWERVKVLEFKVRFVDDPRGPDERPRDPTLEPALRAEASGILAWLVRGHRDYLRNGLQTPDSVRLARDAYRRGESIDAFIEACCVEADDASAEGGAVYEAYRAWCEVEQIKPKSMVWLGTQLKQRYEKGRVPQQGRTCYFGIGIEYTLHHPSHLAAYMEKRITKRQTHVQEAAASEEGEGLGAIPTSSHEFFNPRVENIANPSLPSLPSPNERDTLTSVEHKESSVQLPPLTHQFYAAYRAGDRRAAAAIIAAHPGIDWSVERRLLATDKASHDGTNSRPATININHGA